MLEGGPSGGRSSISLEVIWPVSTLTRVFEVRHIDWASQVQWCQWETLPSGAFVTNELIQSSVRFDGEAGEVSAA